VPDQQRPAAEIAAAVVVDRGRVLLVRRRVAEGVLSWQFPAGAVEEGESAGAAAVREAWEETGLRVRVLRTLGERVHPATGRLIAYVACAVDAGPGHAADAAAVGGPAGATHSVPGADAARGAYVADPEELAELVWCARGEIPRYVPYGLHAPVQAYLDGALTE
jgi:8-oxo-dGTP diphosphatase